MRFEEPNLDDRKFKDLVDEALQRIPQFTKEWTDLNYSDPGRTLIELFAYMTETLIYRLNRVPEKHYIRFMDLIGLELQAAIPAETAVTFWLSKPQELTLQIPAYAEASTTRTETEPAIIFTTDNDQPLNIFVPHIIEYTTSDGKKTINKEGLDLDLVIFATLQKGDSFHIEFAEDLSNHIIGLDMELSQAEGAGVNPDSPPYIWEARTSDASTDWKQIEIDGKDGTKALNTSGTVRLFLPAKVNTLRQTYQIRCRLTDPAYRVSPKLKGLTVGSWGLTANATNVSRYQNEILGRSDGLPGQSFRLQHTPIIPLLRETGESLYTQFTDGRKDERWERVSDFSSSTKDDRHFTLDLRSGEVRFGPALRQPDGSIKEYGAIPPRGALIVMRSYRAGGGVDGNLPAHAINVLKTSLPYIDRVSNRIPATGGMDTETMENAKMRVPGHLRSLQRAVTPADFEYLTKQIEGERVGRVHCLQSSEAAGQVTLVVIPAIARPRGFIDPAGLRLSTELRASIVTYLDERRLLSTHLEVLEPVYRWTRVEVRLHANQYANPKEVEKLTLDRLYGYLNPLTGGPDGSGWPFGRDLYKSDIMAVLMSVAGVDFVHSVKLTSVQRTESGEVIPQSESDVEVIQVEPTGIIVSDHHIVEVDDPLRRP